MSKIAIVTDSNSGISQTQAKEMGISIKVETNGQSGVKNALTAEDIAGATGIIVAADKYVPMDRFKGKPVVEIPISTVMKSPKGVINKIHEKLGK